jgi:hypothetical protein
MVRQSWLQRHRRRVGEAVMIACGIALAIGGLYVAVPFLPFAGLAVAGLAVISVFWR